MRINGRRFAQRTMQRQTQVTTETRDGILWDVDWDNYIARVKIQGSDEYIPVHFPRNEGMTEGWMRPGNAVRIVHKGGIRGYSEITGHGYAIPTPSSGVFHPAVSNLADAILTGCELSLGGGGLELYISSGTVRIDGLEYSLESGYVSDVMGSAVVMNDPYSPTIMNGPSSDAYVFMTDTDPPVMSAEDSMVIGVQGGYFTLDAAPAVGLFRYDVFVIGTDGQIDYITGTASSTPVKPSIPANHVMVGNYIFLPGGTTTLTSTNLGTTWTKPKISTLLIDDLDEEWEWDEGDDTPEINIVVKIKDQYGWDISLGGSIVTLYLLTGTGLVYSGTDGWNGSSVTQHVSGSSYTFKYQRDQTETPETSPTFMVMADTSPALSSNVVHITLLDEFGNEVLGGESAAIGIQIYESDTTVAIDWSAGGKAEITVEEDITFTMTGSRDGDKLVFMITQDGTGGWEMTWPANVRYGAEITEIKISEEADSTSYVGFIYCASASKYDVVANVSGYGA